MTIQHTHSFVLYNAQGSRDPFDEIKRLGLKVKQGQGNAMIRRAINLYLEECGALQVQQGAMLFVFPKENKAKIQELKEWIVHNDGRLLIFDGCGDMETIASSLHDQFDEYLERMATVIIKMQGQKRKDKALAQIEHIKNLLTLNARFMTDQQRTKLELLLKEQSLAIQ